MKILFVGNSHTFFNDMVHTFARLWEAGTGEHIAPIVLCHPGMGFDYHVKEYFEVRYDLLYGEFDYAVFQQKAHPFAGTDDDFAAGVKLANLAKAGNVTPVFSLTWAEQRAPEHQEMMNEFHDRLCAETGAQLSPVGRVWQEALRLDPTLPLYFADGEHASIYGDYLIAATHYRHFSGKSALGLPNIGTDFFDPEKKGIRENAESGHILLDEDKCHTIQQAVENIFGE